MRSRLRRIGGLAVASCTLALIAAPSAGAALAGDYAAAPTDDPAPANAADHFGANIVNAGDVNNDGRDDLMVGVPDAPGSLPGLSGKVVFVDGQTGGIIATVRQPSTDTLISHVGASTAFGAQVVTIGDIGSCSGAGANCNVGPKDGYPEHVVTAPGSDISSSAVDMGIVYVLDGKTNEVLKRIELAPDDRPASPPGFGKSASTAAGEPACAGFG